MLEIDLDYPQNLHVLHKDLPFCAHHLNSKIMTVPTKPSKNSKLFATFYYEKKYIIHYKNLKQALENDLVLRKIHRVLKFNQSA